MSSAAAPLLEDTCPFSLELLSIMRIAGVIVVYFFSAKLGLTLAFHHTNVSPVWPPAGVALAAMLIFGYRIWPAIALGAFLANYITGLSLPVALGISIGNTLEAIIGVFLIRRLIGSGSPLERVQDVLKFVLFAGMTSTALSALMGTMCVYFGGFSGGASFGYLFLTWWLGDCTGCLLVTPFILTWVTKSRSRPRGLMLMEFILVLLAIFAVSLIVFGRWVSKIPLVYLTIPLAVLASFRFEQLGASSGILMQSAVAIWFTRLGYGPFLTGDLNHSLLYLQTFMGVVSVTTLILAAAVSERKSAETAVSQSELKYRKLTEQIPAVTYMSEFGPEGRWLYVSPQIQSLLGYTQEEWISDRTLWFERMHPDDRNRVLEGEDNLRTRNAPFAVEYRMYARDGRLIWVRDEGVLLQDNYSPGLYQGIIIDISDERRGHDALQQSRERYENLVQSIDGIVFQCDARTFQFSFVSKQAENILGYPVEQWIAEPDFWMKHVHPDDLKWASEYCIAATSEGKDHVFDYRMIAADGRTVWLRDHVNVISKNGKPQMLRGLMIDITERKRAESIEAALYRIAEKSSSAVDMQEFYASMHAIVSQLMYARNFYIALYDPVTDLINFPYVVDEIDQQIPPQKPNKGGRTAYVFRNSQPMLINEELFGRLLEAGEVNKTGTPSVDWLGVPLKTGDETIGVLAVHSYTPSIRFGEKDKELLIFVSQHIATAIERKRAAEALRKSEEQYRQFFEEDLTGDYVSTPDGKLLACNPAFIQIFGFNSVEEAKQFNIASLYPNEEVRRTFVDLLMEQKKLEYYETELRRRNGEPVYVIENATAVFDDHGKMIQIKGYVFDITERKKLEEQLYQAQKIKAVGQLAGGVAHDFNNTLMAITGHCDLLLMKLGASDPVRKEILEIQKAADHGASLTRQLLAFSRKQILAPKVLDLNQVLFKLENMLRRIIGEDIELRIIAAKNLGRVQVDPGQIEQVLMNLVVNARDAMQEGGQLILETLNQELDDAFVRGHVGSITGRYVLLTVSDTGSGMDEATQSRIFEPFFTTKEKGTGLGLSTVYGIVKQSGGYLTVYSEVGKGTTFRIYLPLTDLPQEAPVALAAVPLPETKANILLVDDNEPVRKAVGSFLRMSGYRVWQAGHPHEAIELARKLSKEIDLVVTDVVMPQMSGRELAQRLTADRPDLKIIFISGYTEQTLIAQEALKAGTAFLAKPFPMQDLVRKIQDLLLT